MRSWGDWGPFDEGEAPSRTGTVVLLGWGGAHVDELRDVADEYLKALGKGWRAVATTLSAHPPPGDGDKRLANRVDMLIKAQFSTVADACASADDVVFAPFSNNGAFALKHLLQRFPDISGKVRAIAFDSAAGLSVGGQMPDVRRRRRTVPSSCVFLVVVRARVVESSDSCHHADRPRGRVAAPPRVPRGSSEGAGRGAAAFPEESRSDIPRRSSRAPSSAT